MSATAKKEPAAQEPEKIDDPTMDFLRRLHTPGNFKVVRGVPIFTSHKRKHLKEDGTEEDIVVTEDDLQEIARNAQHLEKKRGTYGIMTLGHRKKGKPQNQQPPIVGYQCNLRVARYGPEKELGIVADHYIEPKHMDEVAKHPFRSVEYYHKPKVISGVALLKTDPHLDLGMVDYGASATDYQRADTLLTYERDGVCYTYGVQAMPEETDDDLEETGGETEGETEGEEETATPPLPPGDMPADLPGGGDAGYQDWLTYAKQCPEINYLMEKTRQDPAFINYAATPGGAPGPTNVAPPTELNTPMTDTEPTLMERDADPVQYAKSLEEELKKDRKTYAETQIQQLKDAGYLANWDRLLKDVSEKPIAYQADRFAEVVQYSRKAPTGKGGTTVTVARARGIEGGGRSQMTEDVSRQVIAYATKNKITDFDEAYSKLFPSGS